MSKWRSFLRGACYVALVGVLAVGAFWAGTRAETVLGVTPSVAHAAEGVERAAPVISDRAAQVNGQAVGEVLIDDTVVIRMRTAAGGFSAHERAMIVANRLQRWLSEPHSAHDLSVRMGPYGGAEVRAAGQLIADVNEAEANAIGSTATGIANAWRNNIMMALGAEPAPVATEVAETPETTDPAVEEPVAEEPEGFSDKIVPILSLGEGTRVGAARINGPRSKVNEVTAVTQLETSFRNYLEIDIYVPVKTEGGLDRVQQVGLTAVGDYRL